MLWAYHALFLPLLFLTTAFAWWRGQWPERAAATAYLLAWLATELLQPDLYHRFRYMEAGVLVVDAALVAALAYLAIRSGRGWLIWATAFQLLSTSAHLARAMDPSFSALAYAIMEGASSYPTQIALAFGIFWNPAPPRTKGAGRF
jgi:hypothetical protein